MKLKRFLLPILAWSGLMLTSCHCEHEEDDGLLSSLQVGNVVCSDGNILSMDKFKQSDKEAVAIVFHVNRSAEADNLGYAVYIHDIEPLAFADSLGIDQGTSASLTDEDGNENTYSLFNNDEVSHRWLSGLLICGVMGNRHIFLLSGNSLICSLSGIRLISV